jgi:alkylhydroperoxidase family enzyme
LTEGAIAEMAHPERSTLPEDEKYALMFAELFLTNPDQVTDELIAELQEHFTDGQIVEIMFFAGTYNTVQRFNTAMDVEPRDGDNLVTSSIRGYGVEVADV